MDSISQKHLVDQLLKIPGMEDRIKQAIIIPRFEVDEADAPVIVEFARDNPGIVLEALVLIDGLVKARAKGLQHVEVVYLASMWDIAGTYQDLEKLHEVGGRALDRAIAQVTTKA